MSISKYHQLVEAIRFETTVGHEGVVHLPDVKEGERVEVIVLKLPAIAKPHRKGGWIKGKITIHSDFDETIPGMED
jgi:hypothetical protein